MDEWLSGFVARLEDAAGFDQRLDLMLEAFERFGCTAIAYDFAPVPVSHDGQLITPNILAFRNLPDSMHHYWCQAGYYQVDLVQYMGLRSSVPFIWSYLDGRCGFLDQRLKTEHQPVVSFMREADHSSGVMVPVHTAGGNFATLTGFRSDRQPDFEALVRPHLAVIGYLGQYFHSLVFADFDEGLRACDYVRLTRREIECLKLCAQGMTAKQIAFRLDRSLATVNLHLNAATRKLGARNRAQAIARAAHYRLLQAAC